MFLQGGESANLNDEYPKFSGEAAEQCFVELPEDHSKIVIYAPILPGEWKDGKDFKVKFFRDKDWGRNMVRVNLRPNLSSTTRVRSLPAES